MKHTYRFLAEIPWTKEFRRIPEIAGSHHEKLDGTGYPRGIRGEEIPLQSRMMTIADIYDALTAGDRPYKKGISRDEALDILSHERRAGRVDGALLDLFIEAKIYEQVTSPTVTPPGTDTRARPRGRAQDYSDVERIASKKRRGSRDGEATRTSLRVSS